MLKSDQKSYHLIYFFLQPFFTLVYYLKNFRKPHAKNVMWLFTVFYGSTFAIGAESQGMDIVSYVSEVKDLYYLDLNVSQILSHYQNSKEIDVLRTFLAWMVSSFTSNGYYLIIIYAVIFGYFFSRNIWYILERIEGKINYFTIISITCLFLVIPIWNLNGFRFWTAAHVFIYGLLPFVFEGKIKPLIWCFITPFIFHFSFLITLIPLGTYFIFSNRIKVYFFLFVISFFISEFDITQFNNLIDRHVPQSIAERSKGYRNEENVEKLREGEARANMVWYARYYTRVLRWSIVSLLIVIYMGSRNIIKQNKVLLRLLSFIFLFLFFANLISTIPSGGRFLAIGNMIALSFLTLYFQNNIIKEKLNLSKIVSPFLIFFIIISLRTGLYSVSITTLLGNPILAIITFGENISLNDIIKGL